MLVFNFLRLNLYLWPLNVANFADNRLLNLSIRLMMSPELITKIFSPVSRITGCNFVDTTKNKHWKKKKYERTYRGNVRIFMQILYCGTETRGRMITKRIVHSSKNNIIVGTTNYYNNIIFDIDTSCRSKIKGEI